MTITQVREEFKAPLLELQLDFCTYIPDIELTFTYYWSSSLVSNFSSPALPTALPPRNICSFHLDTNDITCSPQTDDHGPCYDFARTPFEYRTAFITNVVCIALPILTFYAMCSRELLPYFDGIIKNLNVVYLEECVVFKLIK